MSAVTAEDSLVREIRDTIDAIVATGPVSLGDEEDLFISDTLDSFNMIELIARIEERYAIGFRMEDLTNENFGTIAAIARIVRAYRDAAEG